MLEVPPARRAAHERAGDPAVEALGQPGPREREHNRRQDAEVIMDDLDPMKPASDFAEDFFQIVGRGKIRVAGGDGIDPENPVLFR